MDTDRFASESPSVSQEPITSINPISENENEEVELTVNAEDDSDIFFGNEAPRSPARKEEKLIEKVSYAKEILQAEFALWTVVYSFLLTKVWSYDRRNTYRLVNFCVVTPIILWLTVFMSTLVPWIVISIRLTWSIHRRLFKSTHHPPSRSISDDVVAISTTNENPTSPGAMGRAHFTYSYSQEQTSPSSPRERLATMPGSYRRPPQKRRPSFNT